jgi:hypothetical protein
MALEQNPKPCSNPRPLGLMAPNKTPGLVHQWHHSHLTWWLMPAGGPKALLWHHSTELGLAARVAIEPGCDPTSGQLCAGGLPDCPAPAAQAAHSMHTMTHHCTSWYSMAQHCTALHSRDSMAQQAQHAGPTLHGTAWHSKHRAHLAWVSLHTGPGSLGGWLACFWPPALAARVSTHNTQSTASWSQHSNHSMHSMHTMAHHGV